MTLARDSWRPGEYPEMGEEEKNVRSAIARAEIEGHAGDEIILVDLSSVAHPIWHTSQSDPDVNATSTRTVARVRALASGSRRVAVCYDAGRSFRREVDPTYKANRPERDAALTHQIDLALETLRRDGFPVWGVLGFEADDVIATATARALQEGASVLIVSSDKDLLQLVGPRVRAKSVATGAVLDETGVVEKFGVKPSQMCDYLSLVGDSADNIRGAKGIGPKRACEILRRFGSLDAMYLRLADQADDHGLKPSELAAVLEFRSRLDAVRSLIELRRDVEIPYEELAADRVAADADSFAQEEEMSEPMAAQDDAQTDAVTDIEPEVEVQTAATSAVALREVHAEIVPLDYERQLDPRSMREARTLAEDMFRSRMFSAYGTPHGVLSTVMVGRELGIPAMASLRGIHVVEGKHTLAADTMGAIILRSGLAEYFRPVTKDNGELDADNSHASYETLRKGAGNRPVRLTFTIEEAKAAGLVKDKSGWTKFPKQMLLARAESMLARLVYPDLLAGMYTPEELQEVAS